MDSASNSEVNPMLHAGMVISSTYDLRLVVLSVFIAILASYTALDLAGRVTAGRGRAKPTWLYGGAIALGIGIWSMHFVGMLAFSMEGMPITYNMPVVAVSMLVAIIASFGALSLSSQPVLTQPQLLIGGVLMGIGIVSMHYIGMVAMQMEANTRYDPFLFGLSVAIAITASIVALWMAFHLRTATSQADKWRKIGSAVIMGVAISGMHYTGMTAATFTSTATTDFSVKPATHLSSTWLAIAIAIATLIILGLALITSFVDQRMAAQTTLLEQQGIEAKRTQLFSDVTLRIRQSLNLEEILKTAVREIRKALQTDRVVIYRFDSDWKGIVVAESVTSGWTQALDEQIDDPCFREHHIKQYEEGRVYGTNNIYQAGLTDCHIKTLERFEVKANLVAPIHKGGQLLGLLIAHHCSAPRTWQQPEVDLFKQLAIQVGFALDQAYLLEQQAATAKQAQLFTDITLRIRQSLNINDIFKTTVKEVRKVLLTDRVIIYRFDSGWQGIVVAESVTSGWTQALDEQIDDPCFRERHIKQYQEGRVRVTNNIYQAGLTDCHIKILERFEVKANLVAPILKDGQLLGLLIAHHCAAPRTWQQPEIDLFRQLALQIGFALDQATLLEQVENARQAAEVVSEEQRQQKEALQRQLVELLIDVEEAASGNLTVHAEVTADEIGTVADFFNAIIENLRQIVTQVQKAANQVNISVGENEGAIRRLAEQSLKQAEETTYILDSVEQMTLSIQAVADNARQAAEVARTASATAEVGGIAMDRTVASIFNLRETVAETAKKVKRLGESSQQISKVVSLINQIAMQTNVLAINASIEAARAGEEGRGFAVVAEEVGQLAAQSSIATQEIEQIVETIQRETSEVVRAMELGTQQVIEGTYLVKDTKVSLEQILDVSRQIDQLVQSISTATVSQAQTSQAVANLMKEIAKVSESTSDSSLQVSRSLQETVEVARQLQASVGVFNVGTQN